MFYFSVSSKVVPFARVNLHALTSLVKVSTTFGTSLAKCVQCHEQIKLFFNAKSKANCNPLERASKVLLFSTSKEKSSHMARAIGVLPQARAIWGAFIYGKIWSSASSVHYIIKDQPSLCLKYWYSWLFEIYFCPKRSLATLPGNNNWASIDNNKMHTNPASTIKARVIIIKP